MGLVIPVIYIAGLSVSMGLAYYACKKDRVSIEQAAYGSAMLGYLLGSIVGVFLLGIAR
jgi:hypothetical protein